MASRPIHPYDVYELISEQQQDCIETGESVDEILGSYTAKRPVMIIGGIRYHVTTSAPYTTTIFDNAS